MTKETYCKITRPFREHPGMAKGIHIANQVCTMTMYVAYPLFLLYMFWQKDSEWLRAVCVPAISFLAVTVFRRWVNRPRPYEAFAMPPVIKKNTKGKSFPSRHVFSAMMIAMTFLCLSPWTWLGVVFLLVTLLLGAIRVLSGVHYPSDVLAGAVLGVLAAVVGYFII